MQILRAFFFKKKPELFCYIAKNLYLCTRFEIIKV